MFVELLHPLDCCCFHYISGVVRNCFLQMSYVGIGGCIAILYLILYLIHRDTRFSIRSARFIWLLNWEIFSLLYFMYWLFFWFCSPNYEMLIMVGFYILVMLMVHHYLVGIELGTTSWPHHISNVFIYWQPSSTQDPWRKLRITET